MGSFLHGPYMSPGVPVEASCKDSHTVAPPENLLESGELLEGTLHFSRYGSCILWSRAQKQEVDQGNQKPTHKGVGDVHA